MTGQYNPNTGGYNLGPQGYNEGLLQQEQQARLGDTQKRREAQMAAAGPQQQSTMPQGLLGTKFKGDDLIALGQGLLSASGYSRTPISNGQAFGAGIASFQNNQQQQKLNSFRERELGLKDQVLQQNQSKLDMEANTPEMYTDKNGDNRWKNSGPWGNRGDIVHPGLEKVQPPDNSLVTTLDKNGEPVYVKRSEAAGMPAFKGPLVNIEGDNKGWKTPTNHMDNPNYDPAQPPSEANNPVIPLPGTKTQRDLDDPYYAEVEKYDNLGQVLDQYESVIKKYGAQMSLGGLNQEAAQAVSSVYTSLMIHLKEVYDLGALQEADLEILGGILLDPTSPQAVIGMKRGNPIQTSIDSLKGEMVIRRKNNDTRYGRSPSSENNKPLSEMTVEELQAVIDGKEE